MAAASACYVSPDRWFTPHFAVCAEFSLSLLVMPLLIGLERILPFGLLVGFNVLIVLGPLLLRRFGIFGMFTFGKLDLFLSRFVSNFAGFATPLMSIRPGSFGVVRLRLVLLVLIFLAGGPPLSNPSSYVGPDSLSIYSMRLGGRCHDRIYHVDRSDGFDVTHFGFFLNSSLAPVLRFRRSFVSVCNAL